MQMVEATAMVYKVMEEQHKMDSFVPKEPAILKDEMHLNEFALQLCHTHGIPERDTNGRPANIFEMNTSILPLHQQNDPLKNYCCLFTHRYKTVHLEKSVITHRL
jgi:hypothetical protein